jgi:hypothetical protein
MPVDAQGFSCENGSIAQRLSRLEPVRNSTRRGLFACYPTFLPYDLPATTDFNFLHFSWHTLTIGPWPPGRGRTLAYGGRFAGFGLI